MNTECQMIVQVQFLFFQKKKKSMFLFYKTVKKLKEMTQLLLKCITSRNLDEKSGSQNRKNALYGYFANAKKQMVSVHLKPQHPRRILQAFLNCAIASLETWFIIFF